MSDHLTIETPEQIQLEYPLAGVGSRFLALALDTLILWGAIALLGIIVIVIFSTTPFIGQSGGPWVAAIFIFLVFLLQFGYFAFFEATWNGQTPGKRHMHVRVIEDSGRPITVYDAVARNLLRIVDSIPGIYAVGILCALISSQNKRLGDYVAGTVVVHERPIELEGATTWDGLSTQPTPAPKPSFSPGNVLGLNVAPPPPSREAKPEGPSGYDASRLTDEEFSLIEAFLIRRRQLEANVRAEMARRIIDRIAQQLQIRPDDLTGPEPLLEKLAIEYRSRASFR